MSLLRWDCLELPDMKWSFDCSIRRSSRRMGFTDSGLACVLDSNSLACTFLAKQGASTRPNQSLSRTQGPLSNFTYNELDFRSSSNVRLAIGPAFLHR